MCTLLEPARSLYQQLEHLESESLSLSFTPGFPAADFEECGPVIWGYGLDPQALQAAVGALYDKLVSEEDQWEVPLLLPDDAVRQAMALAASAQRPIVIADTQDNPGAGGDANTMGMLKALLKHQARNAAIGLIYDPAAVQAAMIAAFGFNKFAGVRILVDLQHPCLALFGGQIGRAHV